MPSCTRQQGFFIYDHNARQTWEPSPSLDEQFEYFAVGDSERKQDAGIRIVKYTAPLDVAHEVIRLLGIEGIDEPHLMPTFDNVVRSLRRQTRNCQPSPE